ncbi:hypothetical protein EK904_010972 [Melospiza melodia maxima]|nr:hypothetical protein EK904_010972 [Melospiza melodia maxima]
MGLKSKIQKLLVQIWDGKLEVEDSIGKEWDEAELIPFKIGQPKKQIVPKTGCRTEELREQQDSTAALSIGLHQRAGNPNTVE